MKKIYTPLDLTRAYEKEMLRSDCYVNKEMLVRCFMDELEYRQKRFAKKKSTQHYDDWKYYITNLGRLARIRITGKKPIGLKYLKDGTIYKDEYGIYRSDVVIDEGQIVKHRPLIEEISYGWSSRAIDVISFYLDGGKSCTMTIDRDFYTAYEPEYNWDFCLEGDLVTGKSCMSGNCDAAQEFYGGIDGCKVARFENEDGEQVGRCLLYEYDGIRHFIRIYVQPDYGRCALSLLRKEMKEGDLFGRGQAIDGMCLTTDWNDGTETLYLDGNYYGARYDDEKGCWVVGTDYWSPLSSTDLATVEEEMNDRDYYKCEHCGGWTDRVISVDDNWETRFFCCEDCANSNGFYKCEHCGSWERDENGYFVDDTFYCSRDCLNRENYYICDECGEIVCEDDALFINGDVFCCEDCVKQKGYIQCADCGDWKRKEDTYECEDGERRCKNCGIQRGLDLRFIGKIEEPKTEQEQNNDEQNNQ